MFVKYRLYALKNYHPFPSIITTEYITCTEKCNASKSVCNFKTDGTGRKDWADKLNLQPMI